MLDAWRCGVIVLTRVWKVSSGLIGLRRQPRATEAGTGTDPVTEVTDNERDFAAAIYTLRPADERYQNGS